jgi:hypothetical protein
LTQITVLIVTDSKKLQKHKTCMPCKYSIERNGKLVIERWFGVVSPDEILAQKDVLLRNEDVASDASVLSDCRDAEFVISQEALQLFAKAEEKASDESRIRRYGFLVRDDVYQQAQFFSDSVKPFGVTAIVFDSFDVACAWVGMEPATIRKMMDGLGS